jgi:hypothetical protein
MSSRKQPHVSRQLLRFEQEFEFNLTRDLPPSLVPDWDPMALEVVVALSWAERSRPSLTTSTLEAVSFAEMAQQGSSGHSERAEVFVPNISNSRDLAQDSSFATTLRNTSLVSTRDGMPPDSTAAFTELVTGDLPPTALQPTPIRHHTHRVVTPVVPRWSARLVKKVVHQTSAVVAAQNLLMRKLGLLQAQNKIESANFDDYIKLFAEGLSESQAQMINDMFMDHVPVPAMAELTEIVEE